MRMCIEIDEKLLVTEMKAGSYSTKSETVEAALKMLVRNHAHRRLQAFGGQVRRDDGRCDSRRIQELR